MHGLRSIFSTVAFLFVTTLAFAQYTNVQIARGSGRLAPEEPSICISPANTDIVVAGANIAHSYFSKDGGATWKETNIRSTYGVYGDPCIVADEKGRFYFLHLSDPSGKNWADPGFLDRIVCQPSKGKGKKWKNGAYMGLNGSKDQDKEWATVDPTTGNVYATWTQFDLYNSKDPKDSTVILFSRSENKGKSWSEPQRINQLAGDCLDDDETVEGAVPTTGPNGELYVAWSLNDNIYFDRSMDQGKTWMDKDIVAITGTGGWSFKIPGIQRTNGMPITMCDKSTGPNKGTIYINWSDQRNGVDDTDIWLAKSTDGGDSWSAPKRVNDDQGKAQQFFTWMDIDQETGYIYIVFYDRRGLEGNATDVYLAWSKDGGETFVNEKISTAPFTPVDNIFFGDYNNISAHNGRVRPIWTRYEEGSLSIWTALIDK